MRILKQYLLTFTLAFGAVMAITIFIVQQSVPVTAEAMPVQIILDAGHGGEDGGASTANGVPESQIKENRRVSDLPAPFFRMFLGILELIRQNSGLDF